MERESAKPDVYRAPKMPEINSVGVEDIAAALRAGIADFLGAPVFGLFFGAIYALGGLALFALVTMLDEKWMIIPIAIGFPLIGPFVAVGLYEVSRRRASNQPLSWKEILLVVAQQRERQFGWIAFVILCIFWIWLVIARILFAVFLGFQSFPHVTAFLKVITTTPEGLGFIAVGTVFGAILAFVLFASTVIAIPLLLDRDVDVITAMITSFKTVHKSPVVMIGWGVTIATLVVIAMLPLFLGVIFILPILGHATWHLYKRAIKEIN